jgi:hypothetical protein
MAAATSFTLSEGQSTTRPPLFNGAHYTFWKARMKIFIQANDWEAWKVIKYGPFIPTKLEGDIMIAKDEMEWTNEEVKRVQINCKAINMLHCALDANEFNRVSGCESAKEIWDKLEVTHEGTNQVKETKINMLVHSYELFKMKQEESISDMVTRFTNIINGLKALGKSYSNSELVRKLLRSLPSSWSPKVTAIEEAKNLNLLSLDELVGSLMTHEIKMIQDIENEDASTKKKNVAFKAIQQIEDESEEDEDNDEIALIARKFHKFLRKNKFENRRGFRRNDNRNDEDKMESLRCFECKKVGHIKHECPMLKGRKGDEKKGKEKSYVAVWEDSDSDSDCSKESEEANLCLMAHEQDEVNFFHNDLSFDELLDMHEDLIEQFKDMLIVSRKLKSDLEESKQACLNLENENERLKLEIAKEEKCHNCQNKKNVHTVNSVERCDWQIDCRRCYYCGCVGHIARNCHLKRNVRQQHTRMIWVPKGTFIETNHYGPKFTWVPKTKA